MTQTIEITKFVNTEKVYKQIQEYYTEVNIREEFNETVKKYEEELQTGAFHSFNNEIAATIGDNECHYEVVVTIAKIY